MIVLPNIIRIAQRLRTIFNIRLSGRKMPSKIYYGVHFSGENKWEYKRFLLINIKYFH